MWKRLAVVAIIAAVLTPVLIGAQRYERSSTNSAVRLLLVRGESTSAVDAPVAAAWSESAREVGIPFAWISADDLVDENAVAAVRSDPVVVLPDATAQGLPDAILDWAESYVTHGGHLLVVYDAGTRDQIGSIRPSGLFEPLLGITYSGYEGAPRSAYATGRVSFMDGEEAALWNVPQGKLTADDILSSYSYGTLTYPLANARRNTQDLDVAARSGPIPVLTTRRYGQGTAVWSALPLGRLCAYGTDALPIDAVLQTVAVDLGRLPRLLLAPGGGGGLVIVWHVESNSDWSAIPMMQQWGLLRPGIHQEFDIAAGPDVISPGDSLGFDACGKGRDVLSLLLKQGEAIGSDGGGTQNLFASQLEQRQLTNNEIRDLVAHNASCLTGVTGQRMQDYTAPLGVYPQPQMTRIIQQLGFLDYYYTGDTGSAPQLAFWDGKLVSSSVWAFPVMPYGRDAALADMAADHISAGAVEVWLKSVAEYAASQGTIRLIYSHPPDLETPGYASAYASFLGYVAQLQSAGQLVTEPMHVYADFLNRRARAQMTVDRTEGGVQLTVTDRRGLRDIAVGVPNAWRPVRIASVTRRGTIGGEQSYVVQNNTRRVVLRFTI
jgi:hypothetical protein